MPAASPATLAEVVAGVRKRIGRWQGSIRVTGRRGEAVALAEAIRGARLSLAAVADGGCRPPRPRWSSPRSPTRWIPAWTRGHRFTVAQQITDLPGAAFVIAARDGEAVSVTRSPPAGGPDATVSMSARPSPPSSAARQRPASGGPSSAATAPRSPRSRAGQGTQGTAR